MTESAVALTRQIDSAKAGTDLGRQLAAGISSGPADVVIVFASSRHDFSALLKALKETSKAKLLMGCSSAGEFTGGEPHEGSACAVALRASDMKFSVTAGRDVGGDPATAAGELAAGFQGLNDYSYRYRSALVLTDALAGRADQLVENLTQLTAGTYQFFGGGAGDDARFSRTHVFSDTAAMSNAAVGLEILSNKPVGIGVRHGWSPASKPMRVTQAEGMRLISMDSTPACEVFVDYAEKTRQVLQRSEPIPFFLHNVLGIEAGDEYKLRVPLGINADDSVLCAAEVPEGSAARIMTTDAKSAAAAALEAANAAVSQLQGHKPKVALFFDCVATRLRTGREFGFELDAVRTALGGAQMAGFNTYGQIARAKGQFSGFHNCTAVACVIPE
jgi:hypothetical protein